MLGIQCWKDRCQPCPCGVHPLSGRLGLLGQRDHHSWSTPLCLVPTWFLCVSYFTSPHIRRICPGRKLCNHSHFTDKVPERLMGIQGLAQRWWWSQEKNPKPRFAWQVACSLPTKAYHHAKGTCFAAIGQKAFQRAYCISYAFYYTDLERLSGFLLKKRNLTARKAQVQLPGHCFTDNLPRGQCVTANTTTPWGKRRKTDQQNSLSSHSLLPLDLISEWGFVSG